MAYRRAALRKAIKTTAEPTTLREILPHASRIYKGTKDERQSIRILEDAYEILGLDTPIAAIRTRQLDDLVLTLSDRGLSTKTINRYLAPVSKSLRWALARDLIEGVPHIPRQKEGPGRNTIITEADELRLVTWFEASPRPDMAVIARVLLGTGFRIMELLTRKPKDLRDGWLHLEQGETKNDDPRAIPLSRELAADLAPLLNRGMPGYNTVQAWFERARKALNLKVTPHVLRHTAATRLNACDVPMATVKEYMGHRSIVTTMKYVHVRRESIRQAAEKLRAKGWMKAEACLPLVGSG